MININQFMDHQWKKGKEEKEKKIPHGKDKKNVEVGLVFKYDI